MMIKVIKNSIFFYDSIASARHTNMYMGHWYQQHLVLLSYHLLKVLTLNQSYLLSFGVKSYCKILNTNEHTFWFIRAAIPWFSNQWTDYKVIERVNGIVIKWRWRVHLCVRLWFAKNMDFRLKKVPNIQTQEIKFQLWRIVNWLNRLDFIQYFYHIDSIKAHMLLHILLRY